jgi:hypothetical protein
MVGEIALEGACRARTFGCAAANCSILTDKPTNPEIKCERAADLATNNRHAIIAKFLRDYIKEQA